MSVNTVLVRIMRLTMIILIFTALLYPTATFGQTEVFGFGGYMMTTSVPVRDGDLQVKDVPNYGLGVDFQIQRGLQLEVLWITQETHLKLKKYPSGLTEDLFDMNTHYFQLGAVYEMGRKKTRPFFAFTVGATLFDAKDATRSDEWLASVTLGMGGKFDISKSFGIRVQGRILLPLIFSGGSIWVGTGGVGVGVGSWTPFVQFDLTAGVYIKLGK